LFFFKTVILISNRNILAFDGSWDAMMLLNLIHKRFQKMLSQGLPFVFYLSSGLSPGGQLIGIGCFPSCPGAMLSYTS